MAALEAMDLDPVRVLIVDDAPDIRLLLRIQFGRDPRFAVVGEATDGFEAIELAGSQQPDLVILDRQMPGLGGMEAMPEIRRRSPDSAIVLYTANADPGTVQAAVDAGAIDVLDKLRGTVGFVDQLVDTLFRRATTGDTVEVRVGPVSAKAARVWIPNTRKIIDAVAAHPEVLGQEIPEDVIDLFRSFIDQWDAVAASTDEFRWVARAKPNDVSRIVGYWAAVDAMTDEQLAQLDVHWSPPEGEPFFSALTAGVLEALKRHEETRRLAARLGEQWAAYQRDD
jgi:CheY-like chemotaxis protein